jgi:hypothetical protein
MFAPILIVKWGVFVSEQVSASDRTAEIVEPGLLADVKEGQRRESLANCWRVDERGRKKETAS